MEITFSNPKHKQIWEKAVELLTGIGKKDYVLHCKMVTRAMQDIIKGEGGDENIMIPAAMLHDIGLSKIPKEQWFPKTKEEKDEYERLHIELAGDVIPAILSPIGYSEDEIKEVLYIAQSHKSKDPQGDARVACMVDADNLSDTYQESFFSDVKSYGNDPMQTYEFRSQNKFFTKTANDVFQKELAGRLSDIQSGFAG